MEESHKRSRSETLYCYVLHDDVRSGIQLRKLHYHEERHHLRHFCGRTANAQFRFQAVHQILHENNIHTTTDMIAAYLSCSLGGVKGLGRKFFVTMQDFISHQHKYQNEYKKL